MSTGTAKKPSVLFVCVHNAGRSQMAAAFLTTLGGAGTIELHTGFGTGSLKSLASHVTVESVDARTLEADVVVPAPASARTWTSWVNSG